MSGIKDFIGETLIYGFANVFSRVFAMILIPLYQGLGQDTYSNITMLQMSFSIMTFLMALNSGVFFYYYEYERIKYRKIVFTSWFYYELFVALALISLIFVFKEPLAGLFIPIDGSTEVIQWALVILSFQFIPYIFNITNINYFRIDRKPKQVMLITLSEAAFTLGIVWIGIEYFNFGIIEVVAAQFFARLVVALLFIKTVQQYLNFFNFSKKMLKKLFAFSWPFFIISTFSWAIISLDKFIGVDILPNKSDVALLALAMQLSLPIAVLADMIRMAIGPFVMSIRKNENATKSYQQVFDLSVFSGFSVLLLLIIFSPVLIYLLTEPEGDYFEVLRVLPLIAFASVLSLVANQFAISFSLVKKNIYILYSTVLGGTLAFVLNFYLMREYGFVMAGISQIASYSVMAIFLYLVGKKKTDLDLKLKMAFIMATIIVGYLSFIQINMSSIIMKDYWAMIFGGIGTGFILTIVYFKFQKLTISKLVNAILKRT
jgi:O-antigen/teichoic acid export membrane protein